MVVYDPKLLFVNIFHLIIKKYYKKLRILLSQSSHGKMDTKLRNRMQKCWLSFYTNVAVSPEILGILLFWKYIWVPWKILRFIVSTSDFYRQKHEYENGDNHQAELAIPKRQQWRNAEILKAAFMKIVKILGHLQF